MCNLQVKVLVPLWVEGRFAGVCVVALPGALHADFGEWVWQAEQVLFGEILGAEYWIQRKERWDSVNWLDGEPLPERMFKTSSLRAGNFTPRQRGSNPLQRQEAGQQM